MTSGRPLRFSHAVNSKCWSLERLAKASCSPKTLSLSDKFRYTNSLRFANECGSSFRFGQPDKLIYIRPSISPIDSSNADNSSQLLRLR